jgi:hypothetical protein
MNEYISPEELSLGQVLCMFVLDTILYTMLARYLDAALFFLRTSEFDSRGILYFE